MRKAKTPEHLAYDGPKFRRCLRRRRTRLELFAHGLPVEAVHRLVEMSVADDLPGGVEGLGSLRYLRGSDPRGTRESDRGDDSARARHLMSALICAGGSNVERGTLSNS